MTVEDMYNTNSDDVLDILPEIQQRENLRLKLLAKRHDIPSYLSSAAHEVDTLLKQTVIQKENHSVVLIGPRNNYKTTAIEKTLRFLNEEHASEFIVIHLNGMLHFEQHAIKSIASQMEEQLRKLDALRNSDDERNDKAETFNRKTKTEVNMTHGSLSEVFQRFIQVLDYSNVDKVNNETDGLNFDKQDMDENSKKDKVSIIFLFDEIDLFAGPVRQTLLYNLFDMVENSPISFCIIGLSTKLNLLEFFEKRVKSRFSNRTINFLKPKTFDAFQESYTKLLTVDLPENETERMWNFELAEELKDPDSQYNKVLRTNYDTVKDTSLLWNGFAQIFTKKNFVERRANGYFYSLQIDGLSLVENYEKQRFKSTWSGRLGSLSDLEMIIMVCTTRVALKNNDSVTFNTVYSEYSTLISTLNKTIPSMTSGAGMLDIDKTFKLWQKTDIKNVWESLIKLGFLIEKGTLGLRDSAYQAFIVSNYQTFQQMVPFDLRIYNSVLTLHEIRQYLPSSSSLYTWTQI